MSSQPNITIFMGGSLGDTLVAVPALHGVRRHWPGARITLLSPAPAHDGRIRPRDVLEGSGLVDDFREYPVEAPGGMAGRFFVMMRELRRCRPDVLVYLIRAFSGPPRLRRDRWIFRLCGIPRVIGTGFNYQPPPRQSPAGVPVLPQVADLHLQQLASGGIPVPARGEGCFDLCLRPEETAAAAVWAAAQALPGDRPCVSFGTGSNMTSKLWPQERFEDLGQRLIKNYDIHPVLFGGPEDADMAAALVRSWRRGTVAAGSLSPREAVAAMRHTVMYVGNDTGTMHLAAAAGLPCVALFSARDYRGLWEPYGTGHYVLRVETPCAGCFLTQCNVDGHPCMRGISVEEVFDACADVLTRVCP